jgi:hypothetical protein
MSKKDSSAEEAGLEFIGGRRNFFLVEREISTTADSSSQHFLRLLTVWKRGFESILSMEVSSRQGKDRFIPEEHILVADLLLLLFGQYRRIMKTRNVPSRDASIFQLIYDRSRNSSVRESREE